MSDLRVIDLRSELTVELLGTEVARPSLSWRIESEVRGVVQVSYRIRASAKPELLKSGDDLLFDSGEIADAAQGDIPYAGPPFGSMQRIWWDVTVTDGRGASARSLPTWFETGLSREDWHADWIEAEDAAAADDRAAGLAWVWTDTPLDSRPHAFRLDFDAPSDVARCDILMAGKDHLRGVWVNGVMSDRSGDKSGNFGWDSPLPFWGTLGAYPGDVRAGRNSICALVEADTTGFFPVDGGAFAALIRLHRADGSIERIVSGPDWRVNADAPTGWHAAEFDASAWSVAVSSGANVHNDPRPAEPAMLLRTGFLLDPPGGLGAALRHRARCLRCAYQRAGRFRRYPRTGDDRRARSHPVSGP